MTLSYAICCTTAAQSACSWAHIMCNKVVPYEWVACRQAQMTSTEARRALALASVATMAKCISQNGQTSQSLYAGYCTAKMKMLYTSEPTSRTYNSALQMASTGAQVDYGSMGSNGNFRIAGSVYLRTGPLLPVADQPPKIAQLYLVDSKHELQNRMKAFDKDGKKDDRGMRPHILEALQSILHSCNHFVRKFKEVAASEDIQDGMLGLRAADGKCHRLCFCLRIALCFCLFVVCLLLHYIFMMS